MAKPLSPNTIDNEKRKFKEDINGDVAVNICGEQLQDIIDAINSSTVITKSTPIIHNITIATANIEQSLALAANTKSFIIRTRGKEKLQLSYTSGQSNTNFITIPKHASYEESGLNISSLTLYFQSDSDNTEVEIVEWS